MIVRHVEIRKQKFDFIFSHDEYNSLLWVDVWISMGHVRRY